MFTLSLTHLILAVMAGMGTFLTAYYGWQRAVDKKIGTVSLDMAEKFGEMDRSIDTKFSVLALQINTILEGDIRELRGRVILLESGQSEWVKTLRDRTHEIANNLNVITLKIDRLEHLVGLGGGAVYRPSHEDV